MELLILIAVIIFTALTFYFIRQKVIETRVIKHSQFLAEILKLNKKYSSIIYNESGEYWIQYPCKTLQKYRKYIVKEYVSGYLCGYIGEDVERWKETYERIENNKEHLMQSYY